MSKYKSFYVKVSGTSYSRYRSALGVYRFDVLYAEDVCDIDASLILERAKSDIPFINELAVSSYTMKVFDDVGYEVPMRFDISTNHKAAICFCGRSSSYPLDIQMQ